MKVFKDIAYSGEYERRRLDLYLPDKERVNGTIPVLVSLHGGGLEAGDKDGKSGFAAELADDGIALAAVRYRLYPNAKYPDFIEDAAAATAWTAANFGGYIKDLGESGGIFVGGESAGAYLSMMLCFDGRYLKKYCIDCARDVAGYIHGSAQPTAHFNVLRERGIDTRRVIIDESCPLYYVGTSERLAHMLILVSDDDIPNRLEQNRLLFSTMKHFGLDGSAQFMLLSGKHCAFCGPAEGKSKSELYYLSSDFILKHKKPAF